MKAFSVRFSDGNVVARGYYLPDNAEQWTALVDIEEVGIYEFIITDTGIELGGNTVRNGYYHFNKGSSLMLYFTMPIDLSKEEKDRLLDNIRSEVNIIIGENNNFEVTEVSTDGGWAGRFDSIYGLTKAMSPMNIDGLKRLLFKRGYRRYPQLRMSSCVVLLKSSARGEEARIMNKKCCIGCLRHCLQKYAELQVKLAKYQYKHIWINDEGEFVIYNCNETISDIKWELQCLEVDMVRLATMLKDEREGEKA